MAVTAVGGGGSRYLRLCAGFICACYFGAVWGPFLLAYSFVVFVINSCNAFDAVCRAIAFLVEGII